MKFKKLRLAVGIALVIFIFVIGNIIIFGEMTKGTQTSANSQDNLKLGDPKIVLPSATQDKVNNSSSGGTQTTTSPPPAPPPTTVVHTTRTTGAS